jgi:hypothetical protein
MEGHDAVVASLLTVVRDLAVERVIVDVSGGRPARDGRNPPPAVDQNSSSNLTLPVTPTWYADTLRSKKFDSSWTSCSSMNANGLSLP